MVFCDLVKKETKSSSLSVLLLAL